ncbi:MAG TPA: DUF4261 domain-containing protein [Propionibacteriaceae bacterium]|nr:DUF4261 domain-containing protein [Propionibacteriaceae bacterium]
MSELDGPTPPGADVSLPETPRLLAELWYDTPPDLEDPRLLAALRELAPQTQMQDGSLTVPHADVRLESDSQPVPLLTVVLTGSPLNHTTKTLPDTSQTWDWPGAGAALQGCTGSVLVSELLAERFTPDQRVSGLMSVLGVLIGQTSPRAIFWLNSQRVTDPTKFDLSSLDGVLNVRFFDVGRGDSGADGSALVMDTLGLDLFELPDLQCHFRDYDPGQVAAMLYSTAVYVFTEGDVVHDGHTISGARGDERFVCRHERSLLPPARTVLDVDLGEPYAAGRPARG